MTVWFLPVTLSTGVSRTLICRCWAQQHPRGKSHLPTACALLLCCWTQLAGTGSRAHASASTGHSGLSGCGIRPGWPCEMFEALPPLRFSEKCLRRTGINSLSVWQNSPGKPPGPGFPVVWLLIQPPYLLLVDLLFLPDSALAGCILLRTPQFLLGRPGCLPTAVQEALMIPCSVRLQFWRLLRSWVYPVIPFSRSLAEVLLIFSKKIDALSFTDLFYCFFLVPISILLWSLLFGPSTNSGPTFFFF